MLVPEAVELRVETPDVFLDLGVVLCGEPVPELGTLLAQALDLRVDCARLSLSYLVKRATPRRIL